MQDYAAALEQKGEGRKISTLIDIAMEFVDPYGDVRREPRVLNVCHLPQQDPRLGSGTPACCILTQAAPV